MPTTLNVNEAKTHFSSVVSEVEKNLVAFPGLAGKVNVKCDLFADSSCDWEACNASSAS